MFSCTTTTYGKVREYDATIDMVWYQIFQRGYGVKNYLTIFIVQVTYAYVRYNIEFLNSKYNILLVLQILLTPNLV